ncbi:MAG: VOC family protein [Myxococcales bacterium]|nr:VOC family protein [Myxococcales bacterium]MCB9714093.1 VOC family protein [Myxococcales bacterium]
MTQAIVILYVEDQERAKRFYATVLGVEPTLDVPGMTELPLAGGVSLGLMPSDGIARILGDALPHPSRGHGIPRCELYLRVPDAQASLERALAAGARAVDERRERSWGERVAYAVDPDGHVVAFADRRPDQGG